DYTPVGVAHQGLLRDQGRRTLRPRRSEERVFTWYTPGGPGRVEGPLPGPGAPMERGGAACGGWFAVLSCLPCSPPGYPLPPGYPPPPRCPPPPGLPPPPGRLAPRPKRLAAGRGISASSSGRCGRDR